MNWQDYPNFTKEKFDCKQTGENAMQPDFMQRLQALRTEYGKPMIITSGYRSTEHSIEAAKQTIGPHTTGRACDVAVSGENALLLLSLAVKHGFTGIGVKQKGSSRFLHLDDLTIADGYARPTIWSY